MPELPEVEAVCRMVRRELQGRSVVSARVLRPRICAPQTPRQFAALLKGRRFESVERRGKNILIHFTGVTVWVHLRMTGNLYAVPNPSERPPNTSAYFVLDDGRALVFDDRRGLGVMRALKPEELPELLQSIGLDPLAPEFTAARFVTLAQATRAPIKLLLMDQQRMAGIGNIYGAEALWRAATDPRRPASTLSKPRLIRLYNAIRTVLEQATRSAVKAYQKPGKFSEGEYFQLAVYDREGQPCSRCGRPIRRIQQGGRSTYFCPGCQR